ncbi:MAG: hypothetical protein ACLFQW_06745 [Spirochaetaceae bacterium]
MNTTPSTSEEFSDPYTIVGGERTDRKMQTPPLLSLLLLNRGGKPFRREYFRELDQLGDLEIISIEPGRGTYDVEALSRKFPKIRFLLLRTQLTRGEQINLGIKEAAGRYVFVFWNDMKVVSPLTVSLLKRLHNSERLCTVPIIQNTRMETVPSIMVPAFYKKTIKVIPMVPQQTDIKTLFPFDYCGLYHRERFLSTGGYDRQITNPYWQKVDFGFRSHMWGESIKCDTSFRVRYLAEQTPEDTTADVSYKLFFLKNLTIRFGGDSGILPLSRLFPYYLRSGSGLISAIRDFFSVRRWVKDNRYRFVKDARSVTDLWEESEE